MSHSPSRGRPLTAARQLREAGGWSQPQVAVAAGITEKRLRLIERGALERVRLVELVQLAEALGCSVVDLVPGLAFGPKVGKLERGVF